MLARYPQIGRTGDRAHGAGEKQRHELTMPAARRSDRRHNPRNDGRGGEVPARQVVDTFSLDLGEMLWPFDLHPVRVFTAGSCS